MNILSQRAAAYRATFLQNGATVRKWWQRWKGAEMSPAAEVVLRDLAHYCYARKPTLKVSQVTQQSDPLAMAFAEGRRDVYNRIVALCNLNSDQIDRINRGRDNDY
jgi:hypothetical protein